MIPENTYCKANGLLFHYLSAGEGPLMLFVHGFPEFSYSWRHQLQFFSKSFLTVAPDMRGYNLSEKPTSVEAYHVSQLIADIKGIAENFTLDKFTLVAHDWGGAAAWAFALAHPDKVERLVIINAPHPATFLRDLCISEAQIKASQYMRFFRTERAEEELSANNFNWLWNFGFGELDKKGKMSVGDRQAYLKAWQQPGALSGGLNWYRANKMPVPERFDPGATPTILDKATYCLNVPTLVIWGEKDHALLPSLLDGLEDYVSDLTVERLPQAGHWVVQEFPDQVNQLIRTFIERT